MKFKDDYLVGKQILEGNLKCEDITNTDSVELFSDKNQIVVDSGFLIRQFLINDPDVKGIDHISFGDMNMDQTGNVKDVRPTDCKDFKLDNSVFSKQVDIETFDDDYGYGVLFSVIMEKDECNGSDGSQLITEYGLFSSTIYSNTGDENKDGENIMFSRKTRSGIFKDFEMRLKFTWTIYFKKTCI
jgi:hypothetical protein